jgi:carbamoyl-phosphate synthase large subunit
MNILFTCAGRRNLLLRYFREALAGRGRIYAADVNPGAPALQEADLAFIVLPYDHPYYLDQLMALCRDYRVRLLISLNDLELPLLAGQRESFLELGTIVAVSSPEVVNVCFDKWLMAKFLTSCGLWAPKTYLSLGEARRALVQGTLSFPLVLKPRWGTGSICVEYVEDEEELELAYRWAKRRIGRTILAGMSASDPDRAILIQERLQDSEYVLDIINDLNGRYITTFAKLKLSDSSSSEGAIRVLTVEDQRLQRLGERIGKRLGHVGNLDCDVFVKDGRPYVLDLNPRFGGGYPFTHLAGANLPAALIAWASGLEPDATWLKIHPNFRASKYEDVVAIERVPVEIAQIPSVSTIQGESAAMFGSDTALEPAELVVTVRPGPVLLHGHNLDGS